MHPKKYTWHLVVFTAYLVSARIGLSINAVSGFASLVWFPTGISFASMYILGYGIWPLISAAAFLVNLWVGAPVPAALGISLGNTLEALAGVYAFTMVAGRASTLGKVSDAMAMVLCGAVTSTVISATMGVYSLHLSGVINPGNYLPTWTAWWIGNGLSNLIVAPLILVWRRPAEFSRERKRLIEGALLFLGVLCLSQLIFSSYLNPNLWRPFMVIVLHAWVTLRFGQKLTQLLMLIVAGVALWWTMHGVGPFIVATVTENLLSLQFFVVCLALTVLFFGALRQEREDALQFRKDFITVASHELKTPITILGLQLQVLKYSLSQVSLGSEASIVTRTFKNFTFQFYRLDQLITSLLDVSLLEKGKLALKKEKTNLTKMVEEVSETFRGLLDRENCNLELNLQPDVIGTWDGLRIEQILTNLLVNSLKYGSGKPITVDLKVEDGFAVMSVTDRGVGIAKADQERIFQRFERVDTPQNNKGFGLGLYINKQLVESFGGTIAVRSELSEGATFEVRLPLG